MNNEQVMQLMADNGMHEGGMDNWVIDNAWVKFANLVAAQEREKCAKVCEAIGNTQANMNAAWRSGCRDAATEIRARGTA